MKPNKNLIERFLKNNCTSAEAEIVDRFFKENPDELEHYFPANAWLTEPEGKLNTTISDRILQHIREAYKKKKRATHTAKMIRYIAAASLVGLIIFGVKIFTRTQTPEKQTVATTRINTTDVMQTIDNKTGKVMQITLSDCSVVTLYPNSILQYLPAFEQNRRILYLEGKARFDVRKDKKKPFTVYASGIATTALGTQFVISVLDLQQVCVTLKEGIVKVSPQHGKDTSMQVLLRPGDQLVVSSKKFQNYSLTHKVASVFAKEKEKRTVLKIMDDTTTKKETKMIFKNQPLKEVFRKVEERFDVTIDHKNAPGIEEKLFTGIFLEKDSLKFICDLICKLHSLRYSMEEHVVIISANESVNPY